MEECIEEQIVSTDKKGEDEERTTGNEKLQYRVHDGYTIGEVDDEKRTNKKVSFVENEWTVVEKKVKNNKPKDKDMGTSLVAIQRGPKRNNKSSNYSKEKEDKSAFTNTHNLKIIQ